MKPDMSKAVAAGWISYPEPAEVRQRVLTRNFAQAVESFDSELAWRMWDNGATRDEIARAVGCSRRGVQAVIDHGRINR